MEIPCVISGIDMLGLITITNQVHVYVQHIEYCIKSKNIHIFGWYLTLIRAITLDVKEIIKCLIFMIQIPVHSCPNEFFPSAHINNINIMIEHLRPNWENFQISLRIPIRVANMCNFPNLSHYLEWMLPLHGESMWCVGHQCQPTVNAPTDQSKNCTIIPFVNWVRLKLAKVPPTVLESTKLSGVGKLNISNNLLRCVPRSLIQFRSLQFLSLSNNNISTTIPCQILALNSLKRLDLSHNQISEFSSNKNEGSLLCQSLSKLILSHNIFKDITNDFSIPNLSVIDLTNNQLVNVPLFLANCTILSELKLKENQEIKNLPSFLGDFGHLHNIEIDLRNFSPSLSVSSNQNPRDLARDIKKCLKAGRCINAIKVFCIGENENIRLEFLKKLMDEREIPKCHESNSMHLVNWENASVGGNRRGHVEIWNVRNKDIEVTSKVLKSISELRSLIFLVIDMEKGIGECVKKWVEEFIKINASYGTLYNWLKCVSVIALRSTLTPSLEKIVSEKGGSIEICKRNFSRYTESQIVQLREDLFSVKCNKIVAFRENRNLKTIEDEKISSDYSAVFQCFIANTSVKYRIDKSKNPIVSKETFINLFEDTDEYEIVKLLERTGRIVELLRLFERFGLVVYLDEIRNTPIVLNPCALYNTLISIVTEEMPYLQFGLLSMQKFTSHIEHNPYSVKFQCAYDYMLLLKKLNLIMVLSRQYFIVPSNLPSLEKELNIEQEFRSLRNTSEADIDREGYNRRLFLINSMSEDYCNELIVDILYETPIISTIISNKQMEQPNQFIYHNNNNSTSEKNASLYNGIEPARRRAYSSNELELVSSDNNRTVSVWKNNFLYVDSKNSIKLLVRAFFSETEKGIEIVTARDPLKIGDSFLFRVKTILYNKFSEMELRDILAVPHKHLKDEKNTFLIDSLYKYSNLKKYVRCEFREGCVSKESLRIFAPEIFLDHSYSGLKFQELPYNPNDINTKLGSKHSCVYRGHFQNELVAVKELGLSKSSSKLRIYHEMLKEAKLLSEYRHSCLINVIGISSTSLQRCFIVLKLAPFGELGSFLIKNNPLKPRILYIRFTQQIAAGLDFLHTHIKDVPLIHHDLKPENILVISDQVDSYVNVKIADLNMSKNRAGVDGTTGYRAPEIVSHHAMVTHDYKIDVYSFAMVLVNLISHKVPFTNMMTADTVITIKRLRPDLQWQLYFEKGIVSLLPIIQACWNHQPQDRPDMKSVLSAVSSPSIQLLHSNRSLPTNSSYNPIVSCPIRVTEKYEILCYAFSTTYQGKNFYTKICVYDVNNNHLIERPFEDFLRHKTLLQMCSHKNMVILALQEADQIENKCFLVQYSIVGFDMNLVANVCLPKEIFLVQAMCVDEYRIYLALGPSIYVFSMDSLDMEREILEFENNIQCMLSHGKELWISTQPSLREDPSLKISIFEKESFKIEHRIAHDMDSPKCVSQMVPSSQQKRDAHQAEQQIWCLDSYRPIVFIFDSGEAKNYIGLIELNNYLPNYAKFTREEGKRYRYKNTRICASTNTMWISTQNGCILIFSTGAKLPELLMTLNTFLGPIVFLTPLELLRGSMVACCGQVIIRYILHPFCCSYICISTALTD